MNLQSHFTSKSCRENVLVSNYRSGNATEAPIACVPPTEGTGADRPSRDSAVDGWIVDQSTFYHAAVEGYLPRLCMLAERVAASYKDEFPTLGALSADCAEFYRLLTFHLQAEEALLFPLLRDLDDIERGRHINLNSISVFVRAAEADCRELLALLDRIREQAKQLPTLTESASMLGVLLRSVSVIEENSRRHLDTELTVLLARASGLIETHRKSRSTGRKTR